MNLNETIYSANHMIGVDEPGPNVREITLLALLDEVNALTNNDGTRIPQNEIDGISIFGQAPTNIDNHYYWDQVSLNHVYKKFNHHNIDQNIY